MSDRDYIEEAQAEAKLRFGKELSANELAEKFALHRADHRIIHLKNLRTPEAMTINEAADRHKFESALRRTHEKLRLVNR